MSAHVFELTPGGPGPGHQTSRHTAERALLQRRTLLAAAAGVLAVGGCAVARQVVGSHPVVLADSALFTSVPGLRQAFAHDHPFTQFVSVPLTLQTLRKGPALPPGVTYWILNVGVDAVVASKAVPLSSTLTALNFNPTVLLPGTLGAFAVRGVQYGLPVQQEVLAVRWRKDVFATAGLKAPAPDWTLADFEGVCARLAAFLASGKAPQVASVLPPSGSMALLQDPALWVAFALGFGGSLVADGRFALDGAAVKGLAALVDLLHRFPAPSRADPMAAAMTFGTWMPPSQRPTGGEWAYARMPRFPVRPVITTRPVGEGIQQAAGRPAAPRALAAAATALIWLYSDAAQPLLRAAGFVPVLGSVSAQGEFWRRQSADDQTVGDWQNFLPYAAGWPAIPNPVWMLLAISQAQADPARLPALVAEAVQGMNKGL